MGNATSLPRTLEDVASFTDRLVLELNAGVVHTTSAQAFYGWVINLIQLGRWTSWLAGAPKLQQLFLTGTSHWTALLLALLVVGYNLRYSFFADIPLPKPISILFQTLRLINAEHSKANKDDGWHG